MCISLKSFSYVKELSPFVKPADRKGPLSLSDSTKCD